MIRNLGILFSVLARFSLGQAESVRPVSADATQKGPQAVHEAEYRFESAVDPEILDDRKTEIWAKVYWPRSFAQNQSRAPLLFFLHGNHATCGIGSYPRRDDNCNYTNAGTCPPGYVVTPNHEGYAYVAQLLASHGFVVVSINANRGINCGAGAKGDYGLNLARGRLILKHMSLWSAWNAVGGAPSALGGSAAFLNKIDFSRVGIMGHSRGGEGARAALNQYFDPKSAWPAKIPGLGIRAIFEIGAVDGQTERVLDAPGVAWNQLLPLCDGDVSNLQGRYPFERMRMTANPEDHQPKSLNYVWGANHNFFNTEWQYSDSNGCYQNHKKLFPASGGSPEQMLFSQQAIASFFRGHLLDEANAKYLFFFDPYFYAPPFLAAKVTLNRDFFPSVAQPDLMPIENFSQASGTSASGLPMTIKNLEVRNAGKGYSPTYGAFAWRPTQQEPEGVFQTNFPPTDASSMSALDFRIQTLNGNIPKSLSLIVQLVDKQGGISRSALVWDYGLITQKAHGTVINFETIRIPFRDLSGVSVKKLTGVRFTFTAKDLTSESFALSDIHFSGQSPASRLSSPQKLWQHVWEHAQAPTPWSEPRIQRIFSGKLLRREFVQAVETKHGLGGGKNVMLTFASSGVPFPLGNALPLLVIGDRKFAGGAYGPHGETQIMRFFVPLSAYQSLPNGARMRLFDSYTNAQAVWELGEFSRARF